MGTKGGVAAARNSGGTSLFVREPCTGGTNQGSKRGNEYASEVTAESLDRLDQAVGAVHGRAHGTLSGWNAEGRFDRVRLRIGSSVGNWLDISGNGPSPRSWDDRKGRYGKVTGPPCETGKTAPAHPYGKIAG